MDNLARCAMLAKRDGMSYGQWMAIHGEKQIKKKEESINEGWKPCEWCGKMFRARPNKRFCDLDCRSAAYYENNRDKLLEYETAYQRRYREEKKRNASCG